MVGSKASDSFLQREKNSNTTSVSALDFQNQRIFGAKPRFYYDVLLLGFSLLNFFFEV